VLNRGINGSKEIVNLLVTKGADVNRADKYGWTPLYFAAHGDLEIVRLLLANGVDNVSRADNDGITPLHEAVAGGYIEIAKLLLVHGADINLADKAGNTPLHWSVRSKKYERRDVVKLLLIHGADVSRANNNGNTPWDAARNSQTRALLTKGTLWNLWIMETPNYNSFFQWLPREMVEDTITVAFGDDTSTTTTPKSP
ncbi:MAG: tankyrase-2-like isoform, partial [Gammaproteobacteria bacterium]|nr:tankyrase-2-like isoform [Gammaproteobacteria bacterium]